MMKSITGNRLGLLIGFLMLLTLLFYHETVGAIWALWTSEHNPTYSHGPLLLLVCVYLFYHEWRRNRDHATIDISYVGLMGVAGSSLLWFLAGLGSVQIVQMLSLVAVLLFVLVAALGFQQAKPYLFPVLLIIGALPVWEVFGPYLQANSAIMAGWITSHTIHPSVREGMLIHIPAGSFEVETGCSGLAYFIVSIIIALLFVHGHPMSIWRRLSFLLVAMLVAVVGNVLRVYIIVLSGELTNMQSYFVKVEHVSLGWAIFFIGISIYLWQAGRFIPKKEIGFGESPEENGAVGLSAEERSSEPQSNEIPGRDEEPVEQRITTRPLKNKWGVALPVLVAAISIGPLVNEAYRPGGDSGESFSIQFPDEVDGWQRVNYQSSYRPFLQRGAAMDETGYATIKKDKHVFMFVNYYYRQHQGSEAVSDMNHVSMKGQWMSVDRSRIRPGIPGFSDLRETRLRARNGEEKLVWFWYETNGVRTSKDWFAKLQNIFGLLQGKPSIRVVVLGTELTSNIADARKLLSDFTGKINDKIQIVNVSSQN